MKLPVLLIPICFFASTINSQPSKIFCPPSWAPYTSGQPLPEHTFLSPDGSYAFGRGSLNGETNFRIGIFTRDALYVPHPANPNIAIKLREFEIMTNPLECTMEWGHSWEQSLVVRDNSGSSVGRMDLEGTHFGVITDNECYIFFENKFTSLYWRPFNYLLSFSGVSVTLKNFVHDKVPGTGQPGIVGLDEIFNNADTTVTQTISHQKSISETMSISMYDTNTWSLAWDVHVKMDLPGGLGPSAKHTEEYSESTTYRETIAITRSQTITSSRKVTVLPRSSVRVCSVVGFAENFQTDFMALAEYRVKGWNGEEVRDYLIAQNEEFYDLEIYGDAAYRHVFGSFNGSISLTNEIVAVPPNAHIGCEKIMM